MVRRRLGIRSKLFVVSVALVVSAVGAAAAILIPDLRGEIEARIESELFRHARASAAMIGDDVDLDRLADRVGAATDSRITVVDRAGVVRGDSELTREQLETVENHGSRPEIIAAFATGSGASRRYSSTIANEMVYAAVLAEHGDRRWVVRASRPAGEVTAAVGSLRNQLLAALLLGLVVAVLMSGLASHLMTREVRRLATRAAEIARGNRGATLVGRRSDELGHLAGSLNELAENVAATVSALALERAQFAAVLDGMTDGVIALDASSRVTLINTAALVLLEIDGRPIGGGFSDLVRSPALVDLVLDGPPEVATSVELELRGRRLLATVTPPLTDGGCLVVLHEITALRRLETVRRDFVANVSHELRTPVSVIQANAETLLSGALDDPDHAPKMVEAIARNATRMASLIADLLDLARLEAGAHPLEPDDVELAGAVTRAVEAVAGRARERGKRIELDCQDGARARADEPSLEQVIINLLVNAIDHTPGGGRITVRTRVAGDRAQIEVEDDGPGIAPAHRDRVFERFYRVDPGRSRSSGGTGLGLSIVRHMVEAMGGRVGLTDVKPHGARFWIRLESAG